MSCCPQCGCNYTVNVTNGDPSALLFQNQNITGIGVFDNETGLTIGFRGIVSTDPALTVALNAANKSIELDLDVAAIVATIPQATTTVKGIGETATDAEALAKASALVFITPSNFAAMGSTDTFAGLVELATNAEALTGTSTTLALTPANLTYVIANSTLGTKIFADAVARAAAVPNFEGQYGYQADTNIPYVATGLAAGNWQPMLALGNLSNTLTGFGATTLAIGAESFVFQMIVGSTITFTGGGIVTFDSCAIDFSNSVNISFNTFPASSSLLATTVGGDLTPLGISAVASTQNINSGWSAFTNSAVRKTCDCNTVTLAQLAQIVDTLIGILKTPLLPST